MIKMMAIIFLVQISLLAKAQLPPEQRIQDSIIGWYRVLPQKANAPVLKNGRTFSVAQQEKLNELIRWMYQTYTPVAGLGTYNKKFETDLGAVKHYPPHVYGIDFRVWNVSFEKLWLDANGKFKPIDEEYESFYISANYIPATYPVSFINSNERYVFTWEADLTGNDALGSERKKADARIHPNVYPYLLWQNKNLQNIFLVPGNKLPVLPVTKGELLTMAAESVDRFLSDKKKFIDQQFAGNPRGAASAYEVWKKNVEQYRLNIQRLETKHHSTLNTPAVVNDANLTLQSFEVERDPFVITQNQQNYKQFFTVYRYSSELLQKCRSDQPQWLAITVPFKTKEDGNQEYEMYKAVIENFNYEYAYNYFFNPEKVKGISYKPANEASLKVRLDAYRKKSNETATVSKKTSAPNILFEDDFSTNTIGVNPKGWYISSTGESSKVSTPKDENGKWLKLGYNNPVSPFTLKKPLPQNFNLSFDVVTDEFSSRSGGAVVLYMSTYPLTGLGEENKSKDGAWIQLTIRAGNANDLTNNNFSGEAKLELHTTPPLFRENFNEGAFYTKSLTDFSNKKRKVNVQLHFSNGVISLFINNQLAAASLKDMKLSYGGVCKDCRIPAGFFFNTIRWENFTNNAKETGVYISNISITKE